MVAAAGVELGQKNIGRRAKKALEAFGMSLAAHRCSPGGSDALHVLPLTLTGSLALLPSRSTGSKQSDLSAFNVINKRNIQSSS